MAKEFSRSSKSAVLDGEGTKKLVMEQGARRPFHRHDFCEATDFALDADRAVAVDFAVVRLDINIELLAIDVPSTSSSSWPRIKAIFSRVKAATGAAMSLFLTPLPFLLNLGRHVCGRRPLSGHRRRIILND